MTDWREGGKIARLELPSTGLVTLGQLLESGALPPSFRRSVFRAFGEEQNRGPLIDWLRSDRPIDAADRESLAQALEGAFATPRGRPKNRRLRDALFFAKVVYERWCTINEGEGICDYGHRSEMKNESIRFVLEVEPFKEIDPEAVRGLWDLRRSRQK